MADPAELIHRIADSLDAESWSLNRACLGEYADQLRALLAALTPTPSAEDAAVLTDAIMADRVFVRQAGPEDDPAYRDAREHAEQTRAACLARMAGKVPPGYRIVPVKMTPEMREAAHAPRGYTMDGYPNTHDIEDKWDAMLAAWEAAR